MARRRTLLLGSAMVVIVLARPNGAPAQPTEVAYLDGDGHWQWMEATEQSSLARKSGASSEQHAGPFNVIYEDVEDGTGVGFDDPELGDIRRQTLWAVLDYIGRVIDVPGEADLLIRASQTDGSGALASAGPLLFPESGFQSGLVFEHLTTGIDPSPNAIDGTVTVDFGYPWNSETDRVAENEQDLFTTLLHEVTHALGFLSVVASDGRSAVFNSGNRGLFSVLDSLLIRESTEVSVFLAGGEVNSTADDFVASGDLVFAGERARRTLGFYPRMFAPRPFFEGSSIGHWSSLNGPSVMLPGLARGTERREYEPWEVQALADIGYEVFAEEPPPLPEVPDGPGPSLELPRDAGEEVDPDEPVGAFAPGSTSGCAVAPGSAEPLAVSALAFSVFVARRRKRPAAP
jgi:hypothetical protein